MLKSAIAILACMVAATVSAEAGHRHFRGYSGYHYGPSYAYAVPMAAPAYYYSRPSVVYQSAYVVPVASVSVMSVPVSTVSYGSYYAPSVPIYSNTGYYYPPRVGYVSAPMMYGRHGRWDRPRDMKVEMKYRRDGGYRYEVDYD